MRRASHLHTFGAALLMLSAPAAMAMSFGPTATATTLGQPLDFVAQLALDDDETIGRGCVAARVTMGDNRVAAENVRVTLESARDPGVRSIRVTTRIAVDEPVVTVDLTVGCGSQMSRRFVAFVDPPVLRLASAESEPSPAPQRMRRPRRSSTSSAAPSRRAPAVATTTAARTAPRRASRAAAHAARRRAGASQPHPPRSMASPARARPRPLASRRGPTLRPRARRPWPARRRACASMPRRRSPPRRRRASTRPAAPRRVCTAAARRRAGGTDPGRDGDRLCPGVGGCGPRRRARRRWRACPHRGARSRPGSAARRFGGAAEDDRRAAGAPAPGRRGVATLNGLVYALRGGGCLLRLAGGRLLGVAAAPASARALVRRASESAETRRRGRHDGARARDPPRRHPRR